MKSTIQHCLTNLILLNVLEENTTKKLWDKFGNLYQSKYLVNKLFLWNKLYLLTMNKGDFLITNLNAFSTMISQLMSVDIKITKEEKCINLLCSFPNSWDLLVIAIGSKTTTLRIYDVVASLLSEEIRRNNMEWSTHDSLMVRGWLDDKGKGKPFNGRSKSRVGLSIDLNPYFSWLGSDGSATNMGARKEIASRRALKRIKVLKNCSWLK